MSNVYAIDPLPAVPWNERYAYRPSPVITAATKQEIGQLVHTYFGSDKELPADWNWQWEVKKGEGELTGKFPARLKTWLWKTYKVKATADVVQKLSSVGERVMRLLVPPEPLHFDLTQNLEWRGGTFGDSGSCFCTGSFNHHVLKDLSEGGGGAMRRWVKDIHGGYAGQGRAWLALCKYGFLLYNGRDANYNERIIDLMAEALTAWMGLPGWTLFDGTVENGNGYSLGPYADGYNRHFALVCTSKTALARAKKATEVELYLPTGRNERRVHRWSPPDPEDPNSEVEEEEEE